MTNSLDKWPINYKGFVSAIKPDAPIVISGEYGTNYISFSWTYIDNACIPITNFAIYLNSILFDVVPSSTTIFTIDNLNQATMYFIYVISLSSNIPSSPSNTINFMTEN